MAKSSSAGRNETTKAAAKLARRQARRNGGGDPVQAEYEALNHEVVCKLIDAVVSEGGTITLGTTKDGGAYYINYWVDGVSDKVYIRPTENPDQRLIDELEFWLGD